MTLKETQVKTHGSHQAETLFELKPNGIVPARRVALIHDWLTGMRGGEMVLQEFCRMFPEADIFTLVHLRGSVSPLIEKHRIIESPLAKLPTGRRSFRAWLPLFPWAVESFDLKGYDLIISSSHCVAKGIIPAPDAAHVAYIHTPMRYVWDIRTDYLGPERMSWAGRAVAGLASHYLRTWDSVASARVDRFIANSKHVSRRIRKYYRRKAQVIYPPVDLERFNPGSKRQNFFLSVSALVPYKRIDLAIEACSRLGVRLVIAGDGSEQPNLRKLAGPTIEFIGPQTPENLVKLYQEAAALIHPGEEDFGIVPIEAQACGCPIIAYGRGGLCETVIGADNERPTGIFFDEQTVKAVETAISSFDAGNFDARDLRSNADRFGRERFIREMTACLKATWLEKE